MLTAEVVIPQMFTAYAEDLGYLKNGLHHFQYYCESCGQVFTSAWDRKPGCLQWCEKGDYFYCTHCGTKHKKHVAITHRDRLIPNKVRLSVKTYRNHVTFEVYCSTVQFRDHLSVFAGRYREVFRFDIARQETTFTCYENGIKTESREIGHPFQLEFLNKSILGFFLPFSLANTQQLSELTEIRRTLREEIRRKMEAKLGHKVPSLHVSSGQHYGTFLVPLFNLAYRVIFPNAPNLPAVYRVEPRDIERFWERKRLQNRDLMDEVIKLTRQKTDFITALTTVYSIPNRPGIRRILGADPFEVGLLSEAFSLCRNYDYAMRLYNSFKAYSQANAYGYEYAPHHLNNNLFQFLHAMLPIYGETGVVHLVEKTKESELRDYTELYRKLNEENRRRIATERVRLKNLHDWMAREHRRQCHINLKFNVPEHIINRLSMQKDRLKFFLPKESIELLEAGTALHNCVASYGQAMKDNTRWVVLVADDRGKLAACLEVQGSKLVQAKIDKNRPVSNDPKLNAEVLAWARKAKLEVKTDDLTVKTKEAVSVAV